MPITVERWTTATLEIRRLHKATFPADAWDLGKESVFWVAHDFKGDPVGFVSCEPSYEGNDLFVNRIGVIERANGCGVGDRLLARMHTWARTNTHRDLFVTYVRQTNGASLALFFRAGYRVFAPAYWWAGEGSVYFSRPVSRI